MLLGDRLEIGSEIESHASYLGHWIELLKESPKVLFQMLSEARQAAYLICPEPTLDDPCWVKRAEVAGLYAPYPCLQKMSDQQEMQRLREDPAVRLGPYSCRHLWCLRRNALVWRCEQPEAPRRAPASP